MTKAEYERRIREWEEWNWAAVESQGSLPKN